MGNNIKGWPCWLCSARLQKGWVWYTNLGGDKVRVHKWCAEKASKGLEIKDRSEA